MKVVSSRQNQIVSTFRALAGESDPSGARLLLDGVHLVAEARTSGLRFEIVAVAGSKLTSHSEEGALARSLRDEGIEVIEASDSVLDALSPVKTPSGIVAIAHRPVTTAAEICTKPDAFILAAVDVQEPGNVGALLRAAEAGGVTGAFVCGLSANPFSWKALRGSMGSALRLPIVAGMTADQVLACMSKSGVRTVAAVPRGGEDPDGMDWRGKVGMLLGGEGPGLSDAAIARCQTRTSIPMTGHVESLNVAAAGAILVYAARRQRS
jgi:RNA methyltransferase, TrmH family